MSTIIKPPASLIIGATGTGKTHSLVTYLEAGIETFVMVTEPTGVETLIDAVKDRGLDMKKLHWKLCKPHAEGLDVLIKQAQTSNRKTAADMQKMETGLDKQLYQQYIEFLLACKDFVCDRDGKSYGDITEWDATRAFCVDSWSGINVMVSQNQCGNRLSMTQPEFGICMKIIENLVNTFTGLSCFFTMTAHPEFERDEIAGTQRVMVSTLGKKLAPNVPRFFSEVVRAKREGAKFVWSTDDAQTDTKQRILPISGSLRPSFEQIVMGWNMRKQLAEESTKEIAA